MVKCHDEVGIRRAGTGRKEGAKTHQRSSSRIEPSIELFLDDLPPLPIVTPLANLQRYDRSPLGLESEASTFLDEMDTEERVPSLKEREGLSQPLPVDLPGQTQSNDYVERRKAIGQDLC